MKKFICLMLLVIILVIMLVPLAVLAADEIDLMDGALIITAPIPTWAWALIAIGVVAFFIVLMYLLLPKLIVLARQRGIDVTTIIQKASNALNNADSVVDMMIDLGLPLNIVDTILSYASAGVKYAEQLWKSGSLNKEERGIKAREAITAMLKKLGMDEEKIASEEIQQLVTIGIEAAVGEININTLVLDETFTTHVCEEVSHVEG